MRLIQISLALVLIVSTACTTYEEEMKIEAALTKSLNHFHEQLNKEEFHDIYSEADPSLRERIEEIAFTSQLKNAHEQLGTIAAEERVLLTTRALNDLKWARLLGRKQAVTDVQLPVSELIRASERFEWGIEDNQPRLVSYEFRFICRKPCTIAIGIGP